MSSDAHISAKPALAIIGRPNVGKSTLFNRLTASREALVADEPGMTRDLKTGEGKVGDAAYLVVDTGGIDSESDNPIGEMVSARALTAVSDADALLFVVDAVAGINAEDRLIAERARKMGKPLYLVANKADRASADIAAEFSELGLGYPHLISALRGHGIDELIAEVTKTWPPNCKKPTTNQRRRRGLR